MAGTVMKVMALMLSNFLVTSAVITTIKVYKVASSHNDPFPICTIRVVEIQGISRTSCAIKCLEEPLCRAFCVKGASCHINGGHLDGHWPGAAVDHPHYKKIFTYDYCYAILDDGDVTSHIVDTSSSTFHTQNLYPELVVNGFYCHIPQYHGPFHYCFMTGTSESLGYWRATLDSPQTISTINVWTRGDGYAKKLFHNVEITFGTSSDFNNPVFDSYPNAALFTGEMITFNATSPVTGRYLEVRDLSPSDALCFCNIQLLQ
ncbi:uncharacterized protein LOC121869428 [Homarus americanus]|uniref:Apple domain-containing protein n=1 Tax=Homarus americanus TaxID=6706 RepID=A0A8J5K7L4_HOMAM|nr:uncharacterized protein LOC121869428 [Homarus americanus]XP_042226704.1 uncharacterized protein LOC121869428 [Homarus americanus]KAG7166314.1 hypothetical protein Hamer_G011144 [Homarus americanus]